MADLFEKKTDSIDKSIITVSSKGKELLETAKLKGEVTDTEISIQRKFNALGMKVFEMLNRGALNEEMLKKDSGEISTLFSRITELEEAVKKVELEALKIQSEVDTIICSKDSSPDKSDFNLNKETDKTKIDDQKFKSEVQPAANKAASPEDELRRKTSKTWIGIFTVICLAAGTGSYLYFSSQAGRKFPENTPKVILPLVNPPVVISENPAKIEGDINRAFREARLSGITAVVSDNLEVTLKGSVRSNYKKERAFEIAKSFTSKGIKRIRDMIFVVEQ